MAQQHRPVQADGPHRPSDHYNIENSYYAASGDERDKPPAKLKEMIDAGHLGMKTGQGFYSGYDTEAGNLDVGKK